MFTPTNPIHPGEILREEYMRPLGLNCRELSKMIKVSHSRLFNLTNERISVSVDMANKLSRCFGGSSLFWINMQKAYDTQIAKIKQAKLGSSAH